MVPSNLYVHVQNELCYVLQYETHHFHTGANNISHSVHGQSVVGIGLWNSEYGGRAQG